MMRVVLSDKDGVITTALPTQSVGAMKTLKSVAFSRNTTGNIIASVAGKRLKMYAVKLVTDAALTLNFRDGASIALEGSMSLEKNGGFIESIEPPAFLFATSQGNGLDLVVAGGTAAGRISYWDDDAT
jgi:hypothetical protein